MRQSLLIGWRAYVSHQTRLQNAEHVYIIFEEIIVPFCRLFFASTRTIALKSDAFLFVRSKLPPRNICRDIHSVDLEAR